MSSEAAADGSQDGDTGRGILVTRSERERAEDGGESFLVTRDTDIYDRTASTEQRWRLKPLSHVYNAPFVTMTNAWTCLKSFLKRICRSD